MGYRRFTDNAGNTWEVRDRSRNEWDYEPVGGNPERPRTVPTPGYEKDPFELSVEELQRLIGSSQPPRTTQKKSPFID